MLRMMKGLTAGLLLLTCTVAVAAVERSTAPMSYPGKEGFKQAPAFPGAEGFGKYTQGGRYGRVLFVTTLADYDPETEAPVAGSLRKAIETDGPRTVLFRVSGTIELKAPLWIYKPWLTLAGQSAPGDGICLKNYGVEVRTYEVIIRHMRFRPGDEIGKKMAKLGKPFQTDALGVYVGEWIAGRAIPGYVHNVIIDHCSCSWGSDETLSVAGSAGTSTNITVQYCIISEALNNSPHNKGPGGRPSSGYGSIIGGQNVTFHHNLYAHHTARGPAVGGSAGVKDFRNNVIYDTYSHGHTNVNYVANYIKRCRQRAAFISTTSNPRDNIFADANWMEGVDEEESWILAAGLPAERRQQTPHNVPVWAQVETQSAKEAYERVLAEAGAWPRDAVDRRVVEQVRAGTGKIIDSQDEVGGWPELKSAPPLKDSNHDGMPDEWQTKYGLNPQSVDEGPVHDDAVWYPNNEATHDLDSDGYTNIEEYLNGTDPTVADTDLKLDDPEPTLKWTPPKGWFRGYDFKTGQHAR